MSFQAATDADVFAKELPAFEAKYPGIKVTYTSTRPQDSVQRIVTEKQTGHAIDVDSVSMDLPSAFPLLDAGLASKVDWKALGGADDTILNVQGAELIRSERIILGLGYNTTKLKESDLPNTWDELVDSKWASNKVIVDPRGQYLSGLSLVWGADRTVAWYKKLLATDKPTVVKGATASLEKVISGEALLTTSSHDAEVAEQKSKGAPVAIKYLDIVPTQDHYAIVIQGTPHPSASACFLAWYASPDGGVAEQMKYEFKGNDSRPAAVPASAKLAVLEADPKAATVQTDVASQLSKLTGK